MTNKKIRRGLWILGLVIILLVLAGSIAMAADVTPTKSISTDREAGGTAGVLNPTITVGPGAPKEPKTTTKLYFYNAQTKNIDEWDPNIYTRSQIDSYYPSGHYQIAPQTYAPSYQLPNEIGSWAISHEKSWTTFIPPTRSDIPPTFDLVGGGTRAAGNGGWVIKSKDEQTVSVENWGGSPLLPSTKISDLPLMLQEDNLVALPAVISSFNSRRAFTTTQIANILTDKSKIITTTTQAGDVYEIREQDMGIRVSETAVQTYEYDGNEIVRYTSQERASNAISSDITGAGGNKDGNFAKINSGYSIENKQMTVYYDGKQSPTPANVELVGKEYKVYEAADGTKYYREAGGVWKDEKGNTASKDATTALNTELETKLGKDGVKQLEDSFAERARLQGTGGTLGYRDAWRQWAREQFAGSTGKMNDIGIFLSQFIKNYADYSGLGQFSDMLLFRGADRRQKLAERRAQIDENLCQQMWGVLAGRKCYISKRCDVYTKMSQSGSTASMTTQAGGIYILAERGPRFDYSETTSKRFYKVEFRVVNPFENENLKFNVRWIKSDGSSIDWMGADNPDRVLAPKKPLTCVLSSCPLKLQPSLYSSNEYTQICLTFEPKIPEKDRTWVYHNQICIPFADVDTTPTNIGQQEATPPALTPAAGPSQTGYNDLG